MKKYAITFLSFAIFFLLILGCAKSIDRTYGPIELEINSSMQPYMGEEVVFSADLGFKPYVWTVNCDQTTNTTWYKDDNNLVVDLGYLDNANSFSITISVRDKYGNSAEKIYNVKKIPVKITTTPNITYTATNAIISAQNSNDDLYAWVDPQKMVDFDHWEKDTGPITLNNINTIPLKITNDGTGMTGIAHIWAVNARGQKSAQRTIIVYKWQYIYSNDEKDGYLSKNMQSGIITATTSDTYTLFGYQNFPETVYRTYLSFSIPDSVHVFQARLGLYIDKLHSKPSDICDKEYNVYMKYIGKDNIPSTGVTSNQWIYLDDVPDNNNGYYEFEKYCYSDYLEIMFNGTKSNYGYYYPALIDHINECKGAAFDIGIRFKDEQFSEDTECAIYSGDSDNKQAYLIIYYY